MKRVQSSSANVGLAFLLVAGVAGCSGEALSDPPASHSILGGGGSDLTTTHGDGTTNGGGQASSGSAG